MQIVTSVNPEIVRPKDMKNATQIEKCNFAALYQALNLPTLLGMVLFDLDMSYTGRI